MKDLIFTYLKNFNILLEEYLNCNESELNILINNKNEHIAHLEVQVEIEKEEEKTHIYLKNEPILRGKAIFDELSKGIIELINANSEIKVTESSFEKGWFGWEAEDNSISLGFKNEDLEFEARFSIKK